MASRIIPFVILIPQMVSKSLFPALAKDEENTQFGIDRRFNLSRPNDLDWYCFIVMFVLNSKTHNSLYGNEYITAVLISNFKLERHLFLHFCHRVIFIVQNIHHYAVIRNIIGSLINVGMNYYLIPKYHKC